MDGKIGSSGIDAHGYSSWPRGSRSYEIYNNHLTVYRRWVGIGVRGGEGVVFNNTLIGDYGHSIQLWNDTSGNQGQGDNCNYPCKDQIRELYIWNNITNGNTSDIDNKHPSIIQPNRDYFLRQKEGYTPYIYPHPLNLDGEKPPLQISTSILPDALNNQSYSTKLFARGGQPPYQWNIIEGNPPQTITLNEDILAGTVNDQERTYFFTVQVTDNEGAIVNKELSIEIISSSFSSFSYFGDIKNWEPDKLNLWTVSERDGDKRYIITNGGLRSTNGKLATYSLIKDRMYEDFKIKLLAKSPVDLQYNNADIDIVFGYENDENYYYFMFSSNAPWSALHKVENGSRKEIKSANKSLIIDNEYHYLEIGLKGQLITIKRDQETVFTFNELNINKGRIGIGSFNDAIYFDNIDVTNPDPLEDLPPSSPQNVRVKITN